MKVMLLILLFIVGVYSINIEQHRLFKLLNAKQNAKKYSLLTQLVASESGFIKKKDYRADKYLEDLAAALQENHSLTLQQKINKLKIDHILNILDKVIGLHTQKTMATQMETGRLQRSTIADDFDKNALEKYILKGDHITMDLLIQSFAPAVLTQQHFRRAEIREIKLNSLHRSLAGAIILVNEMLQPGNRIPFTLYTVFRVPPSVVLKRLHKSTLKNFMNPIESITTKTPDKLSTTSNLKPQIAEDPYSTSSSLHENVLPDVHAVDVSLSSSLLKEFQTELSSKSTLGENSLSSTFDYATTKTQASSVISSLDESSSVPELLTVDGSSSFNPLDDLQPILQITPKPNIFSLDKVQTTQLKKSFLSENIVSSTFNVETTESQASNNISFSITSFTNTSLSTDLLASASKPLELRTVDYVSSLGELQPTHASDNALQVDVN